MKVVIFLSLFLSAFTVSSQTIKLDSKKPVAVSKHINSGNYIVDYLVQQDAQINLVFRNDSIDKPIYFLQQKYVEKGQYEMEINHRFFEDGKNTITLEWNGNAYETQVMIEPEEEK